MTKEVSHKHKKKTPCKECMEQNQELTDTLKRLGAEFENYKKRVEKEVQEHTTRANRSLIQKFLPLLDELELALYHAPNKEDDLYKGLQLIHANITGMLEEEGVHIIEPKGQLFDPYKHEALLKQPSDQPPNTIISVASKGYTHHDKVIRSAKVIISGGKNNEQ